MSVIVGIRCDDCVVLAASGSAAIPATGDHALAGATVGDLRVIGGRALLGIYGSEGTTREVAAALERYVEERDPSQLTPEAHSTGIEEALAEPVGLAVAMTRALRGVAGASVARDEAAVHESLVAIPTSSLPALFVVDTELAVTEVREDLHFAAIGSAGELAKSFLTFLNRLLWPEGRPQLAQAQFAAYWAVRHAMEAVGGFGRSVQLMILAQGQTGEVEILGLGRRVSEGLDQAVEASLDQMRRGLVDRVFVGLESLVPPDAGRYERPGRKRVPEVRVMLRPPQAEERRWKW